jgi:uncharacterized protein YdhG (YjbR/CyaY superfamily)
MMVAGGSKGHDRCKPIRAAAPDAIEKVSYQMPTVYQRGNLVHFATFASHIGLYPTPSATRAFSKELRGYKTSKDTIRLPPHRPHSRPFSRI